MKKFLLTLSLTLILTSVSFGAVSEDIYVRKDVFDAKMEALFNRLHSELSEFKNEIKTEISEIRGDIKELNAKFSNKIDALEARMADLRNGFYLVTVLFGMLLGWPLFNRWYEEKRRPSLTVEDVERIIDAKLSMRTQA